MSTKLQLIGVDYQLRLKICQNILHSHCFMSQNACLSLMLQQHPLSLSPKVIHSFLFTGFIMGGSMEDYHLCIFTVLWKNSIIIRSNLNHRKRATAKISLVLCYNFQIRIRIYPFICFCITCWLGCQNSQVASKFFHPSSGSPDIMTCGILWPDPILSLCWAENRRKVKQMGHNAREVTT